MATATDRDTKALNWYHDVTHSPSGSERLMSIRSKPIVYVQWPEIDRDIDNFFLPQETFWGGSQICKH